jgi:xanthine dehydrogenase YagS FAD-binding subunit
VELLRPSSLAELAELDGASNSLLLAGGTEVVPLLRDGILQAERLVDVRDVVPRGVRDGLVGAGTTLAELEVDPRIPDALREACRLAASPQLRNMGSIGGNLLQSTRCWYWRLKYPCRLHGGDRCHAREGEHREHAIFANDFCASAHPSDPAAALLALGARVRTTRRELDLADLYQLPERNRRDIVTLEPGELILQLEVPPVEASVYLKAMDRQRWAFPQVGVAAARAGGETRIALAGVAPVPWLLDGESALDEATPLPRTRWKVDVARALVRRAVARLDGV